jgi:hypothetical protein
MSIDEHVKSEGKKMITEEEMIKKIDDVSANYTGYLDDLTQIVGMVVIGRRYGWRVIRLVNSRRHWALACKHFGDLKILLPERGDLTRKSIGLAIIDAIGGYWDIIRGSVNRHELPMHDRKRVV